MNSVLAATHGGKPIVNLEHEDGHGGTIQIGVSMKIGAGWPMAVRGLSRVHDLFKVFVPCRPVFFSAGKGSGLEAGLGVVVPFVHVHARPVLGDVVHDPIEAFESFFGFCVFPNLQRKNTGSRQAWFSTTLFLVGKFPCPVLAYFYVANRFVHGAVEPAHGQVREGRRL